MITIKKIREDKKFSLRGKKEGEYIDVYQGIDISSIDLDWLYGYFPDERQQTKYIPKYVMRDLFRITEFGESIPYVNKDNVFWYQIISSPSLKTWGKLVSYLPSYQRRRFIRELGQAISKDLAELKKKYNGSSGRQEENLIRYINSCIIDKINESIKNVNNELKKQNEKTKAGYDSRTKEMEVSKEALKYMKVSDKVKTLIKETTAKICGSLINDYSLFVRESVPNDIRDLDAFADETLFLMKVANGEFHKREKLGKLNLDVYLDISGSMDERISSVKDTKKYEVAYGILNDLMNNFEKHIDKIFVFDTKLDLLNRKHLRMFCGNGGTDLDLVYRSIVDRKRVSVVITDLEANMPFKREHIDNAYYIQLGDNSSDWSKVFRKAYQIE
jgi:hypothetical protein